MRTTDRRAFMAMAIATSALPATSRAGSNHYLYDGVGRVSGVILPNGASLYYSYEAAGNRTGKGGSDLITDDGFDPTFYRIFYRDIANAGVDAYQHYNTQGWQEHRCQCVLRYKLVF